MIAMGVVLGDIKESTGPHSWRNPSDTAAGATTANHDNVAA